MVQQGGTGKARTVEASLANKNKQDKVGKVAMEVIDLESLSQFSIGVK